MSELESVFGQTAATLYEQYAATLHFRNYLVGGIPRDPEMMERWIRSKAGITDDIEVEHLLIQTLRENGVDVHPGLSMDELREAAAAVAELKQNGFKRQHGVLVVESRQIKAGIKEAVNILFAGEKWGRTRKGPKHFVAERVFVEPWLIPILHADGTPYTEPDAVQTRVGHVSGPGGPRAILNNEEVCDRPMLRFTVRVLRDSLAPDQWAELWTLLEANGLGATRSQGFGQFVVTEWRTL